MIAIQFGRNLAHCRRRAKLSQEELAVRASLHRTAVGQLERGDGWPALTQWSSSPAPSALRRASCSTGWAGTPAGRGSADSQRGSADAQGRKSARADRWLGSFKNGTANPSKP
jgi:Helix-turn-helix domain